MLFNRHRIPKGYMLLEEPKRRNGSALWSCFGWTVVLIGFFVSAALFSELALAQEAPSQQTISPNNAESGELLFASSDQNSQKTYVRAIHLETKIDVDISGMIAEVSYRQRFRNDSTQWQEAIYVFPLSESSAVNHMEMIIGDRRIVSEIKEREEAKRIYNEAKANGQRAALTEQQRPNLFTQRVANIGPGEEIAVELRFVQQLSYEQGVFEFHLPTTLTPRYIPGQKIESIEEEQQYEISGSGWGIATNEAPDAREITPPMLPASTEPVVNPMQLSLRLNAGFTLADVSSPYHRIQQSRIGETYEIALAEGAVSMDRDFRLAWRPVPQLQPEVALFSEDVDGENYLFLMLVPPQMQSTEVRIPREMVFVIDTSGSMQGHSIVQARQSLQMALSRLSPDDRFNIIEFNNSHRALFTAPATADTSNMQRAQRFVGQLQANGGTNMQPALEAALKGYAPEDYLKQVVFITDGAVGNETALFALIEKQLGDARLFTVGIGSAPNSYFMSKSAQFGRGSFTFIGDSSEVQEKMSALFHQLESPVLSDLDIQWPHAAEQYPARAPDLYAGSPLVVSAKLSELDGEIVLKGKTADQSWSRTISLANIEETTSKGVSTVWGRSKISSLMDEKIRGRAEPEVRQEVLEVALPLKLISAYTSLVAVEEKVVRTAVDALHTTAVPNAVAAGQVQQPGTYPRSATWMPFNLAFGTLSLILWLLVRRKYPWRTAGRG